MTDNLDHPQSAGHTSPFDAIRQIDASGNEYWSARDLAKLLGYAKWDKFKGAIERAQKACQQSGQTVSDHFLHVGKLIKAGKGATRDIGDWHLSCYACYLTSCRKSPAFRHGDGRHA